MGTLETTDGVTARCQTHGGQFKILYSHWQPPAPDAPAAEFAPAPEAMCSRHTAVPATVACQRCGKPLCDTCSFPVAGGRTVCLDCVPFERPRQRTEPVPEPIPAGVFCLQHRNVAATQKCKTCGAYMCHTCDFVFPGNIHLCPVCATASQSALSPKRKKCLIASFVLAAFATIVLAFIRTHLAGRPVTAEERTAYGFAILFFVDGSSIAGLSLGIAAKPRQKTPIAVWLAIAWNGFFVALTIFYSVAAAIH
jgi:hypothetical protein